MIGQAGAGDDTLSRLHEIVEAERARAAGRARVARDVVAVSDAMRLESHRQALAAAALAEFTAADTVATDRLAALQATPARPPEQRSQDGRFRIEASALREPTFTPASPSDEGCPAERGGREISAGS
jgi:hypothetical protein